jgi:hypothetical protein
MADLSIQNAFLDGLEEVFAIMFTDRLQFQLLDEESTNLNIYDETSEKVYHDPIQLIGRIQVNFIKGENPNEGVLSDATITIPTKQLITHNIPHQTLEDFEILKRGKFSYDGFEYSVDLVEPRTLVADKWHTYAFICSDLSKSSLGGE